MNRYPMPQAAPAQGTTEGDPHFIGMNNTLDLDKLDPGYFPLGVNNRCRHGDATPRPGTMIPTYANLREYGTIRGSAVYSNPNAEETILIATADNIVYSIRAGTAPQEIPCAPLHDPEDADFVPPSHPTWGEPGHIEFAQHFNVMLLHDWDQTLQWDGQDPDGFVPIKKNDPLDTSTVLIPPAPWSFDLLGRNFFPIEHDQMGISDLLDYTSYDKALRTYRVNSGTSDGIVGAYPYAQNSVVIGKQRSFDLLTGLSTLGSSNEAIAMEVLTTARGLLARRSWQMVGGDGYFLGDDRHIYRLGAVVTDRLEAAPVPVSAQIEPLMERINGEFASRAVARVFGEYYHLAVPLDDSEWNNAIIVYNTVTKQVEGYDLWNEGMHIDNLLVANYLGSGRLFGINHAGTGSVHLMYEGTEDQLPSGRFEIEHVLQTRAFSTLGWNAATRRDFQRLEVALTTWDPRLTITEITDGAHDERLLTPTPITKDRTRYMRFGLPRFVPTNENDDFDVPGREDYSVWLDDGLDLWEEGVAVDTYQSRTARFSLKARGRFISFRIRNTEGQAHIGGLLLESTGTQREPRRAS